MSPIVLITIQSQVFWPTLGTIHGVGPVDTRLTIWLVWPVYRYIYCSENYWNTLKGMEASKEILSESKRLNKLRGPNSFLLITTKEAVLRYTVTAEIDAPLLEVMACQTGASISAVTVIECWPFTGNLSGSPAVVPSDWFNAIMRAQEKQRLSVRTYDAARQRPNRDPKAESETYGRSHRRRALIAHEFGSDINPVVEFLETLATRPFAFHQRPLPKQAMRSKKKKENEEDKKRRRKKSVLLLNALMG
ncbi:hypothetical protein B0H14DRAFT_2633230 [Mycena olivaceomarginata]|nr:hypothetical protein B0H14DRAFT_2633230 [Mycena olivaceomarginata]